MKYGVVTVLAYITPSPSMRRVWIEISFTLYFHGVVTGHPPCGGCGLKLLLVKSFCAYCKGHPPCGGCGLKCSNIVEPIASFCHPPCGGCGLKSASLCSRCPHSWSPSTRRVWIEMLDFCLQEGVVLVTLHAEGVD